MHPRVLAPAHVHAEHVQRRYLAHARMNIQIPGAQRCIYIYIYIIAVSRDKSHNQSTVARLMRASAGII